MNQSLCYCLVQLFILSYIYIINNKYRLKILRSGFCLGRRCFASSFVVGDWITLAGRAAAVSVQPSASAGWVAGGRGGDSDEALRCGCRAASTGARPCAKPATVSHRRPAAHSPRRRSRRRRSRSEQRAPHGCIVQFLVMDVCEARRSRRRRQGPRRRCGGRSTLGRRRARAAIQIVAERQAAVGPHRRQAHTAELHARETR